MIVLVSLMSSLMLEDQTLRIILILEKYYAATNSEPPLPPFCTSQDKNPPPFLFMDYF